MNNRYIFIDENNHIGFKVKGIHEILETDISITDDVYERFFEEQSKGKVLKIKNIKGLNFEEIFNELPSEIIPPEPGEIDYLIELDFRLSKIELGLWGEIIMTYINCKKVIENQTYGTKESMMEKLDVFLLNNRITKEQYDELMLLLNAAA